MGQLAVALRRRFKTPQDALRALGLDPALLDPEPGLAGIAGDSRRSTVMPAPVRIDQAARRDLARQLRRPAMDGGRRLGRDQDPPSAEDCLTIIRAMLAKLAPAEVDILREGLADLVAEPVEGAEDNPPPSGSFSGVRPDGTIESPMQPSVAPGAQDHRPRDLFARFPSARRIGRGY
jgi:hypothetical protein